MSHVGGRPQLEPSWDGDPAYTCGFVAVVALAFWSGVGLTLVAVNAGPVVAGFAALLLLLGIALALSWST